MAPKSVKYSPNSIIYFKGDRANAVYVLKHGQVSLNYKDLQTGQDVQDMIGTGEFFGVKAALGHFIHDETAVVLQSSEVIQFTVSEFEGLLKGNNRLILKMLKVFSTQLRRIHRQVQGLLSSDLAGNPELGLFEIGEYYKKHKDYTKSYSAFKRYKELYPRGYYAAQVEQNITEMKSFSDSESPSSVEKSSGDSLLILSKQIERGKYKEAFQGLTRKIQNQPTKSELEEAEYLLGVCLLRLGKIPECQSQLTSVVKKYPRHAKLNEVLYYLGLSYKESGDMQKAQGFLSKSLSMLKPGSPLYKECAAKLKDWKQGV